VQRLLVITEHGERLPAAAEARLGRANPLQQLAVETVHEQLVGIPQAVVLGSTFGVFVLLQVLEDLNVAPQGREWVEAQRLVNLRDDAPAALHHGAKLLREADGTLLIVAVPLQQAALDALREHRVAAVPQVFFLDRHVNPHEAIEARQVCVKPLVALRLGQPLPSTARHVFQHLAGVLTVHVEELN